MSYNIERSVEAEASVIGSMLIDETCVGPALAMMMPEDFAHEAYRRVFLAIRKVFTAGQHADLVTILAELRSDTKSSEADAAKLLKDCMEWTPTAANWKHYAEICRTEARLRKLTGLGAKLYEATSIDEARDITGEINQLMVGRQKAKVVTMEEALLKFYERQKEKPRYLHWGLEKLDRELYVSDGKFVILGGNPSDGKTALALSMAWEQSRTLRVGFFSLETDDGTLMNRLVATVAQIQMERIMRRKLRDQDYEALAAKAEEITKRNLGLILAAGFTVDDVISLALAARFDVIYIDYLQLLRGDSRKERYDLVTGISMDLHTALQTTGLNVVALSQLNRPDTPAPKPKKGETGPVRVPAPTMRNLRESGQLEQDADVILLLYRPFPEDKKAPERCLNIAKNKEGRCGSIDLLFDGTTQTFTQPEPTPEEHYRQLQEDISRAGQGFYELDEDEPLPFDRKDDLAGRAEGREETKP